PRRAVERSIMCGGRDDLEIAGTCLRLLLAAIAVRAGAFAASTLANGKDEKHDHKDEHGGGAGHIHAPVPPDYAAQVAPPQVWTDRAILTRGEAIHDT